MFRGRFEHSIDGKGRVSIPAKFREILKREPDNASIHMSLGTALEQLGERDEALQHYREALRLKPDLLPAGRANALLQGAAGK